MFKRPKKKAPTPAVSRAGNYMLGEAIGKEDPAFDPQDFQADPDFYTTNTYLRQGLHSDSSNAENESISSSGTSEDGVGGKKKQKKKGLTFSTFFGTPRMSRRNQGDSDDSRSSRNFEKDTSSLSSREDVSELRRSRESLTKEPTTTKKLSVMSKFKQALITPKSVRKGSKDQAGGAAILRSKGKPPPPPPRRVSSLTREGLELIDRESEKLFGGSVERSSSMDDIISVIQKNEGVFLTQVDEDGSLMSVDAESIDVTMSEYPAEPDVEKCDTLQSMDDLSEDDTCPSLISTNSNTSANHFPKGHRVSDPKISPPRNISSQAETGTSAVPSNGRAEKCNALQSELNFYLDKIKQKSSFKKRDRSGVETSARNQDESLDKSALNNSHPPGGYGKTPFNSMMEESVSQVQPNLEALEPSDSIFLQDDDSGDETNIANADGSTDIETDSKHITPVKSQSVTSQRAGEHSSVNVNANNGEKSQQLETGSSQKAEVIRVTSSSQRLEPENIPSAFHKRHTFSTFGHTKSREPSDEGMTKNDASFASPHTEPSSIEHMNKIDHRAISEMEREKELRIDERPDNNTGDNSPERNGIDVSDSSIFDDAPIAPPRRRRNSKRYSSKHKPPGIVPVEIELRDNDLDLSSTLSSEATLSPEKDTASYPDKQAKITQDIEQGSAEKSEVKPPVNPKPDWIKESLLEGKHQNSVKPQNKGGEKNVEQLPKENIKVSPEKKIKVPPVVLGVPHSTTAQSGSSSCYSDTDTQSSSSYDGKPKRPINKIKRPENRAHEDTTDDEIASLRPPQPKRIVSSRSSTPTLELYNNLSVSGPIARSLPSPCPDSQHNVLVEDDYSSEAEMKTIPTGSGAPLRPPNHQRGRPMTKSHSVPINLTLSAMESYDNFQDANPTQYSQPAQRSYQELPPRPVTPVHHSRCVDMEIDISNELYSPRGTGVDMNDYIDIRNRAVTPSIEQIRSYQRSRSMQNDVLVENLRYRPSTPLIGSSNIDMRESFGPNREVFKKRLGTPVLSGRPLSTIEFADSPVPFVNPVEISKIEMSRHPVSPMKSHPMDMYKSGFASDADQVNERRGNVYGPVADQWSSFNGVSAADRRPPSPVLRAKVNSVLDSLMSRPVGPAVANRAPLIRSQSVDKLLTNNTLVLPPPILDDYLSPRGPSRLGDDLMGDRGSRPGTPSFPLRPPSPFQMPLSRLGYFDKDIDVEFPTPPHMVSQRIQAKNMTVHQPIPTALGLNVQHSIVPPLNLDFIRQRSEEDMDDSEGVYLTSGRSPRKPLSQHLVNIPNNDKCSSNIGKSHEALPLHQHLSDHNHQSEYTCVLPEGLESNRDKQKLTSFDQESIGSSVLKDDDLDVSNACLELSNPVSSDSEAENDNSSDLNQKTGWQTKSMETWTTTDVVDWCFSNTFYQTALIFKGNQMTGADLVLISDQHLGDLGLNDEKERRDFMSEVEKLRLKPRSAASLWRLKQTSMKRRNLEASSELLKERLYSLQQLSSHQNQRINTSMEEVIQQQRQADELLGMGERASHENTMVSTSPQHSGNNAGSMTEIHSDVPLIKWTREDITAWLKVSDMERFTDKFHAYNVTGKDLAAVDMQLLDKLGIDSTEDRELFLSKLYDLQRPLQDPSQDEMIGSKGASPTTPKSETPDQLTDTSGPESISSVGNNSEINAMETIGEHPTSKTGNSHNRHSSIHNKFKDIISPRKFVSRHKEMDIIRIWHDVSGNSMSTEIKISESATSEEVVQKVLDDLEITDDINLFFLTVSSPYMEEGEKELGKFECPLSVQRTCQSSNCRFDLRRRLGITIKVICHVSNMKPRGKGFRVSPYSISTEVLHVALRKFGMSHVDPSLFCLLPINKETGDVRMMTNHEVVQDCESDAFILSNHDNTDQLLTSPDSLPLIQQSKLILRRNSSLNSHGSSGLSQSSETSQGSETGKPRNEKLETLEAMPPPEKMADIETSLSARMQEEEMQKADVISQLPPTVNHVRPTTGGRSLNYNQQTDFIPHASQFNNSRYITPRKQKLPSSEKYVPQDLRSDEHLELMREIALMKESVQERDSTISNLKVQIDSLKTHSKEVEDLKSQLYEIQIRQKEVEGQWQEQLSSAHRALEVKQHQLENANQALQAEHRKARIHEDDDSDSGRETNRSIRGSAPGSTLDLSLDIDQLERELEVIQTDVRSQEEQLNDLRTRRQKAVEESRLTGNTINVQLLGEDCTIVEAKLLRAKQKHADIYAKLELTKREHERNKQGQQPVPSLYDVLRMDARECIMRVELPTSDGHGFIHGRDSDHRLVVKHVSEGHPLMKSDRILEVNDQKVFHLDDQEFATVLRNAKKPVRLVIIRIDSDGNSQSEQEMEGVKEDLALAMMEVESVQQENQDLSLELERLKKSNRIIMEENQQLRDDIEILKKQMEDNLTSSITKQGNDSITRKKTRFGDDFYSGSTDSENGRLTRSTTESSEHEEVIAYHLLDENVPLWESLKTASKKEILQVLKDHILETSQQKNYLDQLMTVVIDNAPNLLEHMDSETDLITSLCWKPQSEEFC